MASIEGAPPKISRWDVVRQSVSENFQSMQTIIIIIIIITHLYSALRSEDTEALAARED